MSGVIVIVADRPKPGQAQDSARFFGTWRLVKFRVSMDGVPFQSSFMALGDGTHKPPVSAKFRKAIGKEAGQRSAVELHERLS